ncbi:hypothetical protein DFJ77DRAFT_467719 [Powellomyces hirtus]|nr:hypothetical protein DFJ77DRAFT_467719 [Powellomyces hirtus]
MSTPTATNTKDLHGLTSRLISAPMFRRDRRLREARVNADRTQRELRRDRNDLERKERHLLSQLRTHAAKGDIHKAKCLAHQVSHYRVASDRNFEAAVMIDTRAQLMVSNHVVNRAEVEAIKGIRHANQEETLKTVQKRQMKYDKRLDLYETMEDIMNEGMDEVYEWGETHRPRPTDFIQEADGVLRQGADPRWGREYFERDSAFINGGPESQSKDSSGLHINLRLFTGSPNDRLTPLTLKSPRHTDGTLYGTSVSATTTTPGAAVNIPTLDISVDMLHRILSKDAHAVRSLGLQSQRHGNRSDPWKGSVYDTIFGTARAFRVGEIAAGRTDGTAPAAEGKYKFVPWDFVESLRALGVRNGHVIWVQPLASPTLDSTDSADDADSDIDLPPTL